MNAKYAVGLVGAGAMGGALLSAWIDHSILDLPRSAVFEPAPTVALGALAARTGLRVNPSPETCEFEALVIAVKPQSAASALAPFSGLAANALVISIMAGKSVAATARALGGAPRTVRAMPNLPAAAGAGATALFASDSASAADRQCAERLMAAAGAAVWVDSEAAIDWATAVSGSGPAYFFLLAEALAEAGARIGLKAETAADLARATLIGAGRLAERDARDVAALRRAVTSPGGTTEAALKVLDGDEQSVRRLMIDAVSAAARRAGELTE
jgi:pyrroline-5-carboxylate reductase